MRICDTGSSNLHRVDSTALRSYDGNSMEIHPDFRELLALLRKHRVEYAIVGGYALAFHGAPRYTGVLDILVATRQANAVRVVAALDEFGFSELGLSASDFERPGDFVRLGYPPVRVDILTSISGVSWQEVSEHAVDGEYGNVPVRFIGPHGVHCKQARGRSCQRHRGHRSNRRRVRSPLVLSKAFNLTQKR